MKALVSFALAAIPLVIVAGHLSGQACCSGGVPISANLGMPAEIGQTFSTKSYVGSKRFRNSEGGTISN